MVNPKTMHTTELDALFATRRYLIMIAAATAAGFNLLAALFTWPGLTAAERVLVIAATVILGIGYALHKRSWALWLFSIGLLLFALTAFAAPDQGRSWLAIGPLVSDAMYFAVTLAPVTVSLAFVPVGVAIFLLLIRSGSSAITGAGLTYAGGWFTSAQYLLGSLLLWFAWRSLRQEALASDREAVELDAQADRLIELTERAAHWRSAASRIHESVLNSIRYVLSATTIDRARLREEVLQDAQHFFTTQPSRPTAAEEQAAVVVEQDAPTEGTVPFNKARLLVTAPITGQMIGGLFFVVSLLFIGIGAQKAASVLMVIAVVVTATVVLRRMRVRGWRSFIIIMIPALVPWVLLMQAIGCEDAPLVNATLNISGFSVLVLAAWTSFRAGAAGLAVWGGGGVLLAFGQGPICGPSMYVSLLNSLVALPIILSVSYAGSKAFDAAQDRAALIRQREIAERSRATASIDLNVHLKDIVDQAMVQLSAIANGTELSDARRIDLEKIDSRIRAAIQVDPQSDGAFAVWVQSLVEEVATLGVHVDVAGLASSRDHTQVPIQVQRLLYAILAQPTSRAPILRAFTDDVDDYVSLGTDAGAIQRAGFKVPHTMRIQDVVVELEPESEDGEKVTVLVSRPVVNS